MFDITTVIDPDKLKVAKNILSEYIEDKDLIEFNILHLYPNYDTKLTDNDCYYDSLKFKAIVYNTELKTYKVLLDYHDEVYFGLLNTYKQQSVDIIRIFANGSVIIRFIKNVQLDMLSQSLFLTNKEILDQTNKNIETLKNVYGTK